MQRSRETTKVQHRPVVPFEYEKTVTQQDVERYKKAYTAEILRINNSPDYQTLPDDELQDALHLPTDDEIRDSLEIHGGTPEGRAGMAAYIGMNYAH